jgi:hypothetical protein
VRQSKDSNNTIVRLQDEQLHHFSIPLPQASYKKPYTSPFESRAVFRYYTINHLDGASCAAAAVCAAESCEESQWGRQACVEGYRV